MINIEELKADRAAGTQGDWTTGEDTEYAPNDTMMIFAESDNEIVVGGCGCCDSPFGNEEKAPFDRRRIGRLPQLEAAYIEAVEALSSIVSHFEGEFGFSSWDSPGHIHNEPGVWDRDASNGDKGGTQCDWCETWLRARGIVK